MAPLFVLPVVGLPGPFFGFAVIGLAVWLSVWRWLPDDMNHGRGPRAGHGAAMSYPSLATATTGASVIASTAPRPSARMQWSDSRIRGWIVAGVASGHAQAAVLTYLGFLVIDRLDLAPLGSEGPIAIVLMAGAAATLAAQWGLIPRLGLRPRALVASGALIAAGGFAVLSLAGDLYALVVGFSLASLGFGFTRPGFTGGASLAVSLAEQGSIAGIITSANGVSYIAAPTVSMLVYQLDSTLPSVLCGLGMVALAAWAWRRLA